MSTETAPSDLLVALVAKDQQAVDGRAAPMSEYEALVQTGRVVFGVHGWHATFRGRADVERARDGETP